jgi:hypothetical protein
VLVLPERLRAAADAMAEALGEQFWVCLATSVATSAVASAPHRQCQMMSVQVRRGGDEGTRTLNPRPAKTPTPVSRWVGMRTLRPFKIPRAPAVTARGLHGWLHVGHWARSLVGSVRPPG